MTAFAEALGTRDLSGRPAVQPGQPAPDFALPRLDQEGSVTLADYRGRTALLLVIERGLYCPFCRRHMVQLGATAPKLRDLGVETLVVFGTPPHRARLYLRHRPVRVPLAADPRFETHRAYGLPKAAASPEAQERLQAVPINPFDDLPEPRPLREMAQAIERDDPYEWTDADQEAYVAEQIQAVGQFLIDADGIVRWRRIEGDREGLADLGRFPTEGELLTAARALPR